LILLSLAAIFLLLSLNSLGVGGADGPECLDAVESQISVLKRGKGEMLVPLHDFNSSVEEAKYFLLVKLRDVNNWDFDLWGLKADGSPSGSCPGDSRRSKCKFL